MVRNRDISTAAAGISIVKCSLAEIFPILLSLMVNRNSAQT